MILGYARVSTTDQNLEIQIKQLQEAGCENVFAEQKSGKTTEGRVELDKLIRFAREGDTIVVCKLDRFARSMSDFCNLIRTLQSKNVSFRCLNNNIDTSGPTGQLTLHILMAVAQFELALREERQREGIEAAKKRGVYKKNGLKRRMSRKQQIEALAAKNPNLGASEIALLAGVSPRTVYRVAPHLWGNLPPSLREAVEKRRGSRDETQDEAVSENYPQR